MQKGTHALGRVEYEIRDGEVVYADGGPVRVMVTEADVGHATEPTLRELRDALISVYGTDFGMHDPTWISRFTDMTRQAASYRAGRVLLAGDAAHVHYPAGGQGLSLGVQDAVNLGWKLAQVVGGTSPESLLDTYHAERHPVAARVLRYTMAQGTLQRRDDRMQALVEQVSELASMDEPRKRLAGLHSGLDIHYDLGEGHPLLGRRMPDLDLVTADGPLRVFELLHAARPLLLNLGQPGDLDISPWADRVQLIDAELPGRVGAPRTRRGQRPDRCADPPRRLRRLGEEGNRRGAHGRSGDMVRAAERDAGVSIRIPPQLADAVEEDDDPSVCSGWMRCRARSRRSWADWFELRLRRRLRPRPAYAQLRRTAGHQDARASRCDLEGRGTVRQVRRRQISRQRRRSRPAAP